MKAALQAKQKNDMEQAKNFLRTAKGFDPMIEAARSGKTVDISTVRTQQTVDSLLITDRDETRVTHSRSSLCAVPAGAVAPW